MPFLQNLKLTDKFSLVVGDVLDEDAFMEAVFEADRVNNIHFWHPDRMNTVHGDPGHVTIYFDDNYVIEKIKLNP